MFKFKLSRRCVGFVTGALLAVLTLTGCDGVPSIGDSTPDPAVRDRAMFKRSMEAIGLTDIEIRPTADQTGLNASAKLPGVTCSLNLHTAGGSFQKLVFMSVDTPQGVKAVAVNRADPNRDSILRYIEKNHPACLAAAGSSASASMPASSNK